VIEVSRDEARRIAVRAQLLDGSPAGVLDTVRKLGFLQMDPISTVAPPQYLVLWSRLGPFERAELDRLIWEERKLVEVDAFIYPVEDLPLLFARMRRKRGNSARDQRIATFLKDNAVFRRYVLRANWSGAGRCFPARSRITRTSGARTTRGGAAARWR
jgi:uncharacterized protein YcaQ